MKRIVIDTETTGTGPNDEVIELAVVSERGRTLFHKYVKPERHESWPDAQKVNHISPKKVCDKKPLSHYASRLSRRFFSGKYEVVGYNTEFDIRLLEQSGLFVGSVSTYDVMEAHERIAGRRMKLTECARSYGYAFRPHGALRDAKATAFCAREIARLDHGAKGGKAKAALSALVCIAALCGAGYMLVQGLRPSCALFAVAAAVFAIIAVRSWRRA